MKNNHKPQNKKGDYINPGVAGDKYPSNVHHIYAKSRGGLDIEENKIKIYKDVHDALHRVFGNATPVESLRKLATVQGKVLSETFKKELLHILKYDDDWYYEKGIYRPK